MFLSKLSKLIFQRSVIIGAGIFLQLLLLVLFIWKMASQFVYIYTALVVISLCVVVYVLGDKTNPAYKLRWVILVLAFPLLGGVFYFLFGTSKISWGLRKSLRKQNKQIYEEYLCKENLSEIKESDESAFRQLSYVERNGFPIYKNAEIEYFPVGEDKFHALKRELKNARKYILMEYFIIAKGVMWQEILDILIEKVKNGVEVRIIYDDCGCRELNIGYDNYLRSLGIKCRIFNPLKPSLSITMNNRDHRKIVVIDGEVGFTGGINIGDEYINKKVLHGHWKDCAVMIRGQAVRNFINLFFEMWNLIKPDVDDLSKYYSDFEETDIHDGYVQPYGVEPYNDLVGENIYLNMINKAKNEIMIYTPYFILTDELITALSLSAKSGVKVKIITPKIGDKWYVHTLSRSYYNNLISEGVEIYEYTPGFIHGKILICDGELASIGTINFDYRSLYLHFECGTLIYKSKVITAMRNDFIETMEKSQLITKEDCKKASLGTRIVRRILRLFAPLM